MFEAYWRTLEITKKPHKYKSGKSRERVGQANSAYNTLVRCTAFEGDREAFVRQNGICDPYDLIRRMLESLAS